MTDNQNTFLDAIAAASEAETGTLEQQCGKQLQALQAEAARAAEDKAASYLRRQRDALRNEKTLRLSAQKDEARRALLTRREQYADQIFAEVRQKLAAYTASDAYPKRLEALLAEGKAALGEGKTVLWLRREDMPLGQSLLALCPGAELREGDFALGGLQLSVDARRADLSFDTALQEQRELFARRSGMEIV